MKEVLSPYSLFKGEVKVKEVLWLPLALVLLFRIFRVKFTQKVKSKIVLQLCFLSHFFFTLIAQNSFSMLLTK